MSPDGRVYAGRSESQRRAERRARLIDAGLQIFGTEGWQAASIERLCASASVATRSFYEEFPNRESLLKAVYDTVLAGARAEIVLALDSTDGPVHERIEAATRTYVRYVTSDPRRAQVVHRELRRVGSLEEHRQRTIVGFTELFETNLRGWSYPSRPEQRRTLAMAVAGAMTEVLVDWVATPHPRPDLAPVVDELVRIFTAALNPAGIAQADACRAAPPAGAPAAPAPVAATPGVPAPVTAAGSPTAQA